MSTELDPNTPHGHTARNARREGRLVVRVTMRDNQMSQMLPDGRGYSGAGPHEIQIYKTDVKNLDALVETAPQEVEAAHRRHARFMAAWLAEDKARVPEAYPGSVSEAFCTEMMRDVKPVVSWKMVHELDTIQMESVRATAAAGAEAAANQAKANGSWSQASSEPSLSLADVKRMIDEGVAAQTGPAIAKAISAERERVAKGGK